MGTINNNTLINKVGPFTQNYKFYNESKKKLKISLIDIPDLTHNGNEVKAYCRNDHGNFYVGIRNDHNLATLLQDKRYKKTRSFVQINPKTSIISVTFEMYKKYR